MGDFYSLDESKRLCENEFVGVEFEFSYYDFSTDRRIKRTDKSDINQSIAELYVRICYAVPKDYVKKEEVELVEEEQIIIFTPKQIIMREYDNISEEAFTYGCEDYEKENFFPHEICKMLWKLDIKRKSMTGWIYYLRTMIGSSSKKNTSRIILRPIIDAKFKSQIYNLSFSCMAYLKSDYPELAESPELQKNITKLKELELKQIVLKYCSDKVDPYTVSFKFKYRLSGSVKEVTMYCTQSEITCVTKIVKILTDNYQVEAFSFNVNNYLNTTTNKLIITNGNVLKMAQDLLNTPNVNYMSSSDLEELAEMIKT